MANSESGKLKRMALAAGLTEEELLRQAFREHKTTARVAKALGVAASSVTLALMRNMLEVTVDLRPRERLRKR